MKSNDFAFEFGTHLSSKINEDNRTDISLTYRQFKPTETYKTPSADWKEIKLKRSIIFDLGFIFNIAPFAVEFGPRVNFEIDNDDPFYGLNCCVLFKH